MCAHAPRIVGGRTSGRRQGLRDDPRPRRHRWWAEQGLSRARPRPHPRNIDHCRPMWQSQQQSPAVPRGPNTAGKGQKRIGGRVFAISFCVAAQARDTFEIVANPFLKCLNTLEPVSCRYGIAPSQRDEGAGHMHNLRSRPADPNLLLPLLARRMGTLYCHGRGQPSPLQSPPALSPPDPATLSGSARPCS